MREDSLFMGLDCSTQSLTAVLIDAARGEAVHSGSVNFGKDLPQYNAPNGYVVSPANPLEVGAPSAMWLDAFDLLFESLRKNADLKKVAAIAGSGQQHASVWLESPRVFEDLKPDIPLSEQFENSFTRKIAPIWMDVSTARECAEITEAAGGEAEVLRLTGSVMTERFTGPQIRKFAKQNPRDYARTGRIHLNSSFMCSVLAGADSPIDYGDGAGMNLMNIATLDWDGKMLSATAEGLRGKLPRFAPSQTVVGNVSKYFVEKYGVNGDAHVLAFTGDNPSSLVGVGAMLEGLAAISLGTSDTFFCTAKSPHACAGAHIFGNPAGGFMGLVCFRNGSLARERLKETLGVDWDFFDNAAFENYIPQDDGSMTLPFFTDEISPKLKSSAPVFLGDENFRSGADKAALIRAMVEGQFLNMRLQSARACGLAPQFIALTGGASKSSGIAQTVADVFQARVGRIATCNSAALGAAMRAAQSAGYGWEYLCEKFCPPVSVIEPRREYAAIYGAKLSRFKSALEKYFPGA